MSLVNWKEFLPKSASVTYSSLHVPDDPDAFDRDLAEIRLPGGLGIDVEWSAEEEAYIVTLFRDDFEQIIVERRYDSASDVVEAVRVLAKDQVDGEPFTDFATSSSDSVEAKYEYA